MSRFTVTPKALYRRVPTSRGNILCIVIGDPAGKPAVVFHGLGGKARSLARELKVLARTTGWRIYVLALPNHDGGCKISRFGFSTEEFCDLLIEAITGLRLEEVPMLVGHSMGGQLAVLVADRRPDLVARRIFLIDPAAGKDWDVKALACLRKPWLLLKLAMELGYDAANEVMGTIYHLMHMVRSLGYALIDTSPNVYRRLQATLAVLTTRNTAAALERLTGRGFEIFIAHGAKDAATPFPDRLRGCTVFKVSGAYHSWHEQDPIGLAEIFRRWLLPTAKTSTT